VHFFIATIVIGAALVLGFSYVEWTIAVLALTLVLSAEMFNQVLKALLASVGPYLGDDVRKALRIGTGAVFVTIVGAVITLLLLFGHHLVEIFFE
jgi:diacylglycerol kinase